jgi:hypothetical protein
LGSECADLFAGWQGKRRRREEQGQDDSPPTIIGPPTCGTFVLREFRRDSLGAEWVCAVADTSETSKQPGSRSNPAYDGHKLLSSA